MGYRTQNRGNGRKMGKLSRKAQRRANAPPQMDATHFAALFDVSRETMQRLEIYRKLLAKWQDSVNLVGPSTTGQFWTRHAADSAQLLALAPNNANLWVDIGSGGGFPGLIIAQFWAERPQTDRAIVHLVESGTRKCAFLDEVIRATNAPAQIHEGRIETLIAERPAELAGADVVSARALAPLPKLLEISKGYFDSHTKGLFLKGKEWEAELALARQFWTFDVDIVPSITDPQARILCCGQPHPVTQAQNLTPAQP